MLGSVLLGASRSPRLRQAVVGAPVTRRVVDRFVAGESLSDALRAVTELTALGSTVTLDHLGEDISTAAEATRSRDAYLRAIDSVAAAGLADRVEASIKLSAFGQALPGGHEIAAANVESVAAAASDAGTTITLDMEDSTAVDSTLAILADVRTRHPSTGAVLQSYLLRTPEDARRLAVDGSRVRLVKGAYRESPEVAHQGRSAVDTAYVECLQILMQGGGYPMVASHDPRMIQAAERLAAGTARSRDSYEFQMLYGIRPHEQRRLVDLGARMRIYLPYGSDWYGYFMRRLAERPANVAFFLRALASRG
ncbi:MAG: proline dehydrogenase [Actinomycetota bacterium]|jgi:proline dehydrogenase|nr:proline dehydrogenase [Actinomycetota bacterium]